MKRVKRTGGEDLSEGRQIWCLEEFCIFAVSRKEILAASDGEGPVIPATQDTETGEWQGYGQPVQLSKILSKI